VFPALSGRCLTALRVAALAIVLAANARPADAQIFSWVDENGSLVVSNVAPGTNLGIPSYDAAVVGYPQRMRDYNARQKAPRPDDNAT